MLNVATADLEYDCGVRIMRNQYSEAFTFCQKACNLNEGTEYFALGYFYMDGIGVKQDFQQAKIYFENACNLNEEGGASVLDLFTSKVEGVKQNFQTAKKYFGKSCDLGFQKGCNNYQKLNEK